MGRADAGGSSDWRTQILGELEPSTPAASAPDAPPPDATGPLAPGRWTPELPTPLPAQPPRVDVPGPTPPGAAPPEERAEGPEPRTRGVAVDGVRYRPRHGERAWRRWGRGLRRLVGSTGDVRVRLEAIEGAQRPITTGRRIAVVSVRGGAGRSTVAALVAEALAGARADPVLALAVDGAHGSVAFRLGVLEDPAAAALSERIRAGRNGGPAETVADLIRTPSGLRVLSPGPGPTDPARTTELVRALSRVIGVTVIDCPVGLADSRVQAVVADAHAVIMVAPNTVDGVRSTRDLLAEVSGAAGRRIVLVVTELTADASRIHTSRAFTDAVDDGVVVVRLPFDRHLIDGGVIDRRKVGEPVRDTATRIASLALARATAL